MVYLVVGHHALVFVEVIAAGVQVAVEAGKVAAADLDAQLMAGGKVDAGLDGLEGDFIHFALFHPHWRLLVAFAITHTLDVVVDVECSSVGEDVDELESEVRIFGVAGNVKTDVDGSTDFESLLQRRGAVDENIVARFDAALIHGARSEVRTHAAKTAAVRGHGIHGVVGEGVRKILGRGGRGQGTVAVERVGAAGAGKVKGNGSRVGG